MKMWIMGHCHQQLVFGLELLVVALIRVPANQGQIRVYHFSIVSWFSFQHLLVLSSGS